VKHLLIGILLLFTNLAFGQNKMGYEMRTNGKSYLAIQHKGFELRHRTDLKENRFTYRHNFKVDKHIDLSVPLHYKVEKEEPTLEPRLVYKFDKFKVWVQKEFNHIRWCNTAIAIDIPKGNVTYRIGWDDSNTFRFRTMIDL